MFSFSLNSLVELHYLLFASLPLDLANSITRMTLTLESLNKMVYCDYLAGSLMSRVIDLLLCLAVSGR
jgi:hypothetical protein